MSTLLDMHCIHCFALSVADGVCGACGEPQAEPGRDRRALSAGAEVGGKYRLGRVLGAGGFGITYLAQDMQLERRVALKEFFPSGLVSRTGVDCSVSFNSTEDEAPFERGLNRFFAEGQILAKFDHPNVVRVHEVLRARGTAYLAMEFLDGDTLKGWLAKEGRLDTARALRVMVFVLDALKVVHATQVIHRDLKPDNIYVTRQGRTLLLDFGGAKRLAAEGDKSVDAMFAHGYAAPEQYVADSRRIGPWTDVYACGATLYKMLTGRRMPSALERHEEDVPFDWSGSDAPAAVRDAVARAVALRHAERFQTVQALADALFARLAAVPQRMPVAEPGPPEPAPAPAPAPAPGPAATAPPLPVPTPRRGVIGALSLAGIGAAVGTGWWLLQARDPYRDLPPPSAGMPPAPSPPVPAGPPASAAAADTASSTKAVDELLNRMIEGAGNSTWPAVEAAASDVKRAAGLAAAAAAPAELASADAAIESGDYAAAVTLLRPLADAQPREPRVWSALGYALLRQGDRAEARRALTRGLRLRPDDAAAWASLGEVLAVDGMPERSADALKLSVYFARQRPAALAHLRSSTLLAPQYRSVIRAQGQALDSLPQRSS